MNAKVLRAHENHNVALPKGGAGKQLLYLLDYGVCRVQYCLPQVDETAGQGYELRRYGLRRHQYADISQLCLSVSSDPKEAVDSLDS